MIEVPGAIAGALIGVGLWLVVLGVRRTERESRRLRHPNLGMWYQRLSRRQKQLLFSGLAGGIIGYAITGWVLMLLLVPAAIWGLPVLLADPPNRDIELLEALDRWVRVLAASLPTGKSIPDAIRATKNQCPDLIRPHVEVLVDRLDSRWSPREALLAMADELASPDVDSVIAALVLAAERGGIGVTASLKALSENIVERLRALREIEAERSKPRVVVRQITFITVAVIGFSLIFNRSYFEPYSSPQGQLILALLAVAYVGALLLLRQMAAPRRRERVIQRKAVDHG